MSKKYITLEIKVAPSDYLEDFTNALLDYAQDEFDHEFFDEYFDSWTEKQDTLKKAGLTKTVIKKVVKEHVVDLLKVGYSSSSNGYNDEAVWDYMYSHWKTLLGEPLMTKINTNLNKELEKRRRAFSPAPVEPAKLYLIDNSQKEMALRVLSRAGISVNF